MDGSIYNIGYISSNGRFWHSSILYITFSVTRDINEGDISTPYISSKVNAISRVLIPLAYKANIWSANILALRYPFFTIIGSKLELWSREVLTLFYLLLFESFYYTISITAVIC